MTTSVDKDVLGTTLLFHGLTSEQLSQIAALMHRKTFPAGATLMSAEQPGEVAYILLSGTVKIHVEQTDGSDVILAILGPGEVVGEMSLIETDSRSATAMTLESSALLWIDRAAFQQCLYTMPTISLNLVRILARRLRLANAQIQSLARQDVFGRVAQLLLAFAQAYGQPLPSGDIVIPLRLTQSDLASLVGASRVRVNQALGFYKQRTFISVHSNHHITVHNLQAIAQRCQ